MMNTYLKSTKRSAKESLRSRRVYQSLSNVPGLAVPLLIALSVVRCGSPVIDRELGEYVSSFEHHCKVEVDVNVVFADLEPPMIGRAYLGGRVDIDQTFWKSANDYQREVLTFHELGHAILYQGHRDKSIMSKYLLSAIEYKNNREWYINELCTFDQVNRLHRQWSISNMRYTPDSQMQEARSRTWNESINAVGLGDWGDDYDSLHIPSSRRKSNFNRGLYFKFIRSLRYYVLQIFS